MNRKPQLLGWEVKTFRHSKWAGEWKYLPSDRCEFGKSPVRDRQSMLEYIEELLKNKHPFEVKPIHDTD